MAEESNVERTAEADEAFRKEAEEKIVHKPGRKLFGTFGGVFAPTLLTILGVIMYLREGWVVGNAGLLGAWLIILISFGISGFTGLSLSSITTNIRIGSGGAFSIISQSLGLEAGGSIGIPLYLSQTLAIVMYIFGFRAGWLWIFPDHPAILVDFLAFGLLFSIAFISAGLAFKVQYGILAVIFGSLVSILAAALMDTSPTEIQWWGDFPGSPENNFQGIEFWGVFAVFFPAATGIMAGANISGDLKNPRKSIPVGTLAAIALSLVIYMLLAWWLSTVGTPKELAENYTIMIDKAAWGPIVLGGLLGATFSSALSSIVGAPRILQAIAEHRVIPLSKWFEKKSKRGEPRNAMLMTGSIVMGVILLRDLNAIAPLITMFFLITYTMINMVVVLEQSLGLVSFRPLFRIPRFVPILGTLGCIFAMFIVNATFSLIAVSIVLALYVYLIHKHLKAPFADVRSGLFAAMAEWAAKKVQSLAGKRERAWKANILLPVEKPGDAQKLFGLLRDISYPKGFIRLLGLTGKEKEEELSERLEQIAERFRESGVFSSWTVVDAATFGENLVAGMEALSGAFFQSNVIFLNYPETDERKEEFKRIVRDVKKKKRGVLMLADPQKVILKEWKNIEKKAEITVQEVEFPQIYVYIEKPERGWEVSMDLGNMDLAILIAYKLKLNWDCELNLIAQTEQAWEKEKAVDYLRSISELARISGVKIDAKEKGTTGKVASPAISVFQLEEEVDFKEIDNRIQMAGGPCLFAMDSGLENALA